MRAPLTDALIREAIDNIAFDGTLLRYERYGSGHINDTFAVYFCGNGKTWRYILQRINTDIFTDVDALMENIAGVTSYLRREIEARGGDYTRETLNVVPTRDGKSYYRDTTGGAWRGYLFIEGAKTYDTVKDPKDFYNAARAFGKFQNLLQSYPAATLHETIVQFHDTAKRYRDFEAAVAADIKGRAKDVQPEIEFVRAREKDTHVLVDMLASGELPLKVTHNDTKLNNVMIDDKTGEGIAVIDLDTVMPGLSVYDFGDSIRFGASTAAEDEKDLNKVWMDIKLYEIYLRGFLETAGDGLTANEIQMLPMGSKLMTLECGMRFLTDYLSGDVYFRLHYPEQNLDRCRTQFKLVADMERQWAEMEVLGKRA
ncbi:MAG: phosphotransferase enzyme family protein [Eubacteriales bacterium]|jgi:hypothetical protein